MTPTQTAPNAGARQQVFDAALREARGADVLSEPHRRILENPSSTIVVASALAADFNFIGDNINTHDFCAFVLKNHDARVRDVDAAVTMLLDDTSLDASAITSLANKIAALPSLPRRLAQALQLGEHASATLGAERLAAALRSNARGSRSHENLRII